MLSINVFSTSLHFNHSYHLLLSFSGNHYFSQFSYLFSPSKLHPLIDNWHYPFVVVGQKIPQNSIETRRFIRGAADNHVFEENKAPNTFEVQLTSYFVIIYQVYYKVSIAHPKKFSADCFQLQIITPTLTRHNRTAQQIAKYARPTLALFVI
jgi:hypothetical protein